MLNLEDFLYDLPKDRIASEPLMDRDKSKLLSYNHGTITDYRFTDLPALLDRDTMLVFNDTRVIPARIYFRKDTGASIEIFLLEPVDPKSHEMIMNVKAECRWKCMIGNARKWKIGTSLVRTDLDMSVVRISENEVTFNWGGGETFSEKLVQIGKVPLPPYIEREVRKEDEERYQTVYSKSEGAVAAPTAGLHFTHHLLQKLDEKGIKKDFITLHVSAGTFQPIKSNSVLDHEMHKECLWINKENVSNLLSAKKVIPVGTTAMRSLESLYWYGVKILAGEEQFHISQKDAYLYDPITAEKALMAVIDAMDRKGSESLTGETGIYIYPGYQFQICDGLITNFHLPGSTLMLLVAALIGKDWKNVYQHALNNDYRFLSYGDGSLLIP